MDYLVGIDSPTAPAHAVLAGEAEALCGARVISTLEVVFPGGASALCRACLRETARRDSTVPLRPIGGVKRPGGM